MTQYSTLNPLGSMAPKDLYDNAQNIDNWSNGDEPFYEDRFGILRRSFSGMNFEFDAAQTGRIAAFNAQMAALGYESKGTYAAGVVLEAYNEYVAVPGVVSGGTPAFFRPGPNATLPLTLEGDWTIDGPLLRQMDNDDVLRADLAQPEGASLVGYGDGTVADALDALTQSGVVEIVADDGENITAKLTDALASGARVVRLPVGTFLFENPLTIEPGFRGFILEGAGILNTTLKATVSGQPSVVMARTGGSTASFYQSLRNLSIDGDGKATYFRNASAYGALDKVRSVNHVETNYHATGLINLHTGCVFPVNPNGVICSNATVWCSHNANYFQGCYIHGGGPTGVAIRLNTANGLESVKNSFHHCTIENGQVLVENGAYAVSFDDNYMEQIKIIASGNCNGLVITNNRGAEAQPFVHLDNVDRTAAVRIADNNLSFDIYVTVANREGAVDAVLDFNQFPEMIIEPNGRRQQPILINGLVSCDMLRVQRARIPGDVSSARVEIIGLYVETPAEATPSSVLAFSLYLRAAASALDGYFIEEKSYFRRPAASAGGVDPYRANYWLASGYVEYPSASGSTTGATARTAIYERNPAAIVIAYSLGANGANSKRWDMRVTGEANRASYLSTDLKLTQIS